MKLTRHLVTTRFGGSSRSLAATLGLAALVTGGCHQPVAPTRMGGPVDTRTGTDLPPTGNAVAVVFLPGWPSSPDARFSVTFQGKTFSDTDLGWAPASRSGLLEVPPVPGSYELSGTLGPGGLEVTFDTLGAMGVRPGSLTADGPRLVMDNCEAAFLNETAGDQPFRVRFEVVPGTRADFCHLLF